MRKHLLKSRMEEKGENWASRTDTAVAAGVENSQPVLPASLLPNLRAVSGLTNHSIVTQALVTSAGSPNSTHCGVEGWREVMSQPLGVPLPTQGPRRAPIFYDKHMF
jgi:hypothetical protein